jgi:hypothetical protein
MVGGLGWFLDLFLGLFLDVVYSKIVFLVDFRKNSHYTSMAVLRGTKKLELLFTCYTGWI